MPHQRTQVLKYSITFYFIAIFWVFLAILICQFRLYFCDDQLIKVFEQEYSKLTGIFHYLPGKFEIFLVSFIFGPVWIFNFIYSSNLNNFFEFTTMKQQKESPVMISNRQFLKNDNIENGRHTIDLYPIIEEDDLQQKKIIIEQLWENLPKKKKWQRLSILLIPIVILLVIHQVLMYVVAVQLNQTNYNLYNICVNIMVVYIILLHMTVLAPLFFLRNKCYIKGDYLWSPVCTFVIPFSKTLDINGLNKAIKDYDKSYLQKLANGEDPNDLRESFQIENGELFWKKSKLGAFSKNYSQSNQDFDDMNQQSSRKLTSKTVRYTTFEEPNDFQLEEFENFSDIDYETNRESEKIESQQPFTHTNYTEQVVSSEQNQEPDLVTPSISEDDEDTVVELKDLKQNHDNNYSVENLNSLSSKFESQNK